MRKSAFSVYAGTKPEPEEIQPNKKIAKNNSEWNASKNKNQNGKQILFSSTLKDQNHNGVVKRKNDKNMSKRAQKKFSKLANEDLVESLKLFSSNSTFNKKQQKQSKASNPAKVNTPLQITKHENQKQRKVQLASKKLSDNFAKISKNLTANVQTNQDSASSDGEKLYSDFDLYDKEIDQEMFDSRKEAANLFRKIISPVTNKDFFAKYWEKESMLIKRSQLDYYKSWFSCKEFDKILRNHSLEFTTNIDVTTYVDQEKENHNPEGRAHAPIVWDFFQQGCSIRLLNPQTYSKNIWKYLSLLQELFGTCVGSNIYLTPAGTQGFAPHYDDIEAFVLQLEGKKRWRVYRPLSEDEKLPRFSSPNFKQSDLPDPIIDVVLEAGDLLYFPRGFVHQANALDDTHSLHITVSCYQKNSWGDYLMKLLPGAIETAMAQNIEFRQGMPVNYLMSHGVAFEDVKKKSNERAQFKEKCEKLVKKLVKYLPIDAAADQMAKQYLHESLPPCFTEAEKSRSIYGHGEKWNEEKNRVENIAEMEPDTAIKLIRRNCMRLVVEEDSCRIYHNLDNGKIYKEKEPQYLECELDTAPAIEFLINKYPKYVTVEELPLSTVEEKITVAMCLYDKGLLVTGEPLECVYEDNDDDEDDEDDEENEDDDDEESEEEIEENGKSENGNDEDDDDDDSDEAVDEDDDDEDEDDEENDGDENGFDSEDYDEHDGEVETEPNNLESEDEENNAPV